MRIFEYQQTTMRCFSPEVVLATFTIEFSLAVYAWWRYRLTAFGRLSVVFLLLLAGFQLSEYAICRGGSSIPWSQIGFVCTALLPIIGIDFVIRLRKMKYSMIWGYALASAFVVVIALYPGIFVGSQCTGQFVAFRTGLVGFDLLYVTYYLTTLFFGLGIAAEGYRQPGANRKALAWILIGYVAFMLPTFFAYVLVAFTHAAVASVLCGFAVILAVILAFKILPFSLRRA